MEALYTNLSPFFAWLLRATLQGSLVVCLILLIKLILRNRLPAKWHYCLWLVLLVRLSLPWAPQSRLSIYNVLQPSRWTGPARAPTPVAPRQTSASALADAAGHDDSTSAQPVSPGGPDEGTTSERTAAPEPSAASPVAGRQTRSWLPNAGAGLSMLWLVGAVVLAGYVLARNLRLWRAVRRERPVTDQQVLELLEDAKMQMGVQTILGVVVTDNVKSPALFGFVRPRLLLPQGLLEGLSLDELHYVFLHELAHLKRRDIYIGWWTAILQILHWFNPLLWFALRRMRADQEMACDALALSRLTPEEPAQYGRTVVSLLERFSQPQYVPSVAGILEDPSNIERRMTMIAKFRGSSRRWSPTAAILIIALSCVSLPDAMGKKGRNVSWPESEPSISLRRIKTGPMSDFSSAPSLDGRYLCDVQYRPVRLTIRDLDTGEVRPLTEPTEGYFRCPVISPQSKYVAYVHQSWSPPKSDLQLIRMDGTGRRVLHRLTEDEKFHIRAWAPDGKEVIGAFKKGGKNLQLVAFSIQDGSMQVIHTFDTYWPMWQSPLHKVAISPDGRYIAYDRPPEKGSWNAEIYVLDIEQQRATCVVGHPAYDKLLGWPPDGNHIFFTSDRRQGLPGSFTATNTRDAYLLPVAEGRAQGAPVLIKRDIPDKARPKGFTHDGTYHYAVEFMSIDAVVAKLDMQTGKLATKPQAVGQTGADQIPAWSPDGRYLAYGIHQPDRSQTIRIQDMETGRERELDPNLPHFSWLRWSPDGKSFLVSNFAKSSPRAIYRIDSDTGERRIMVQSESSQTLPGEPQLSLDGSILYYVLYHVDSKKASLMSRDIESGREEELFALDGTRDMRGLTFALSPDGQRLALATQVRASSGMGADRRISIVPAKGGEPKELWKTEERPTRPIIAWTPDGQSLLFTKQSTEGGRELWLVPAGGGQARRLCSAQEMMCQGMLYGAVHSTLDVHPDGQRIAFDCFEYRHEVWAMENFLPQAPVASEVVSQPNFREIRIPTGVSWGMQLSPGGRNVSLVSEKRLWIMPTTGQLGPDVPGEPVELNTENVPVAWTGHDWSADGKWIAFNEDVSWDQAEGDRKGYEGIYVVSSDGGTPKKVCETYRDQRTANYRISLSPDGKTLAFSSVDIEKKQQHVYTIPVDGGEPKRLVDMQAREPVYSPDGKMIAFVEDGNVGRSGGDLWVIPTQGGTPRHIADAVNASSPIWSPAGDMIAFLDYGAKGNQIHVVHVTKAGEVVGDGIQIEAPAGVQSVWLLAGWSPDNKIAAVFDRPSETGLYTLSAGGGKAVQVARGGGTPRWFPDGTRISCIDFPKEGKGKGAWQGLALGSLPAEGGTFTAIPLQSDTRMSIPGFGVGNRVSLDGEMIVFSGKTEDRPPVFLHNHIWTIPTEGGTPKQLTEATDGTSHMFPCWSPNGKTIAFIHARMPDIVSTVSDVKADIYTIQEDSGKPTALTTESDGVNFGPIAWSPDGNYIAYYSQVDEAAATGVLRIISTNGNGESRIIGKVNEVHPGKEFAWSPDSKQIAFNGPDGETISIMSVEDGSIASIETELVNSDVGAQLDWSPDGERFVFVGGKGESSEFWMVENFLPKAVASANQ